MKRRQFAYVFFVAAADIDTVDDIFSGVAAMTCLVSTLTQWPYHARTCGVTETLEFWRSRMELSMIIGEPVRSTTKLSSSK